MAKPPSSSSIATLVQRQQVAEAVIQGFLDSAVASDLSTAKTNGYIPGMVSEAAVDSTPIKGINR